MCRAESVFTIEKGDFKKVGRGLRLSFALHFYQSNARILPNIVLRKSKKPPNVIVNEVKRTDI